MRAQELDYGELQDQRALVTGANSSIGRATVDGGRTAI